MFQRAHTELRPSNDRLGRRFRKRLKSLEFCGLASLAFLFAVTMVIATAPGSGLARALETAPRPHPRSRKHKQPETLPAGLHIPHYDPGPLSIRDGETLTYKGSWLGVPAALVTIKINRGSQNTNTWRAGIDVATTGLVKLVFRMQDELSEQFAADPLSPHTLVILNNENRRHYRYKVDFDPAKHLVTAVKTGSRGVKKRSFIADNPWGPITGTVMALSQPLKVGKVFLYDVFAGRDRYVVQLAVEQRERIHTALGTIEALRVAPSIRYSSNNDWNSKVRSVAVWVSADRPRLPLRIESRIFVGWIRIDLVGVNSALASDLSGQSMSKETSP